MRRREAIALLAFAPAGPFGDGVPDFLRLRRRSDQEAFRAWFVWLAECLHAQQPELPADVTDCSGMLRFAYREALRRHDGEWAAALGLRELPPIPGVGDAPEAYARMQGAVFRVVPGPFRNADLRSGAFRHFADARHLMSFNAHLVARTMRAAQPADLLFYEQLVPHSPFHSMIVGEGAVLYHTGPIGRTKGEIRKLTFEELASHREPRWRPVEGNPNFLGVFRWNILGDPS